MNLGYKHKIMQVIGLRESFGVTMILDNGTINI